MLKLEITAVGDQVQTKADGAWATLDGSHVQIGNRAANYPVMSCFSEQEVKSGARTVAAQIWARASDNLRRSMIHAIEAALNQTLGAAAARPGVTIKVDVRQVGADLQIDIDPGVSRS